jgi:protein-S-isoprenylcysteine O-methyltransferase Ste14
MELFPPLRIGWLNGWLFLAALGLTDAVTFRLFPKTVVERLFDRSGWSRKQVTLTVIGKLIALISLVLIALTPLKIGRPVLVIGLVISVVGLIGLVSALISFRNAPLDQPVTGGLYKVSRHPQIVMSFVVLAGACLAVGSWSALAIQFVSHFFTHLGILGEEEVCTRRYGDSYCAYLKRVPRYFVFF